MDAKESIECEKGATLMGGVIRFSCSGCGYREEQLLEGPGMETTMELMVCQDCRRFVALPTDTAS